MTESPTQRLTRLGITLPEPAPAVAAFVPALRHGDTVYISGQIAIRDDGTLVATGRLGAEVDVATGREAARVCALNLLAQLGSVASLDAVERLLKVTVYVASTSDFTDQPQVADGASVLLNEVLGAAGPHARAAIGVAALPAGTPVEIEAIAVLRPGTEQRSHR
jgi:enamine deaminase RidA (YjgF/YER057c/UK114 family)